MKDKFRTARNTALVGVSASAGINTQWKYLQDLFVGAWMGIFQKLVIGGLMTIIAMSTLNLTIVPNGVNVLAGLNAVEALGMSQLCMVERYERYDGGSRPLSKKCEAAWSVLACRDRSKHFLVAADIMNNKGRLFVTEEAHGFVGKMEKEYGKIDCSNYDSRPYLADLSAVYRISEAYRE